MEETPGGGGINSSKLSVYTSVTVEFQFSGTLLFAFQIMTKGGDQISIGLRERTHMCVRKRRKGGIYGSEYAE